MFKTWRNTIKASRFLIFQIITMTIFLPASIFFISEMEGPNLGAALGNSRDMLLYSESAPLFWGFLLLINLLFFLYLKPIFIFSRNCRRQGKHELRDRKRAAGRFNRLPLFVIVVPVIGLLLVFILDVSLNNPEDFDRLFPFFYSLAEALTIGVFTGTLMYLSIENMLFSSKKLIFTKECDVDQKYSSFYMKLFLAVGAIVFFLLFQIFDSFSSFYLIGAKGPSGGEASKVLLEMNRDFIGSRDFIEMSQTHKELSDVLKVLYTRIFIFCLYGVVLLREIKKMLKNPLDTVQLKLEGLNLNKPLVNKQIDIVNNDEFTGIYREINQLIDKQNLMLKRSEEKLEKIVDNAGDPIISFHDDGSIYVFNPAAESFFGYNNRETDDLNMVDLFYLPEKICEECEKDSRVFIDYISNFDTKLKRFTGIHKNGKKMNFESNVSRSETARGPLFTAILRDITGQIEFEEALEKAKVSAEKANKMKSEFLANMSHELRTPLNAVLGFTQLLSNDKNLTTGQIDKINTISRSGEHLLGLINDILDISKIESGKTEMHENVFDFNQFINDLKDLFILKCRAKGLSFYVEYAGEVPPFVEGDLGKLRQIMINLIGNAVKFTSEGGISLIVGKENGNIRFSVNDTGKGIPQGDISRILQPFMQSSNVDHEGGTGLGLAITNSFLKLMGGELEIHSQLGSGSTFSFELPLKASDTAPVVEPRRKKVLSIKEGKMVKALIVDDKINNRIILKNMLENVGFITMEAENGLQAIERTGEFDPSIIFMDIKMPVMDGYESVKRLKETAQGRDITIFALTASAFQHNENRIYESGFDGFLSKPFKMESLYGIISDRAGVEFNYEDKSPSAEKIAPETVELDYQVLGRNLTPEELETLSDSILINDFAAIKNYAAELSQRDGMSGFTVLLRYYAENFNDQKLEEILEEIRKSNND